METSEPSTDQPDKAALQKRIHQLRELLKEDQAAATQDPQQAPTTLRRQLSTEFEGVAQPVEPENSCEVVLLSSDDEGAGMWETKGQLGSLEMASRIAELRAVLDMPGPRDSLLFFQPLHAPKLDG